VVRGPSRAATSRFVDAARIDHDQLGAFTQALLHARGEPPGGPSVGLAPITMITSAFSTDLKVCVPAGFAQRLLQAVNPWASGNTRAQVSTLLLPKAARTSFCTR